VPSQPKGTRAYQDAATYNHQLAQHQAFTQAQAASQAANTSFRNPYIAQQAAASSQQPQPPPSSYVGGQEAPNQGFPNPQPHQAQYSSQAPASGRTGIGHQNSANPQLVVNTSLSQYPSSQSQGAQLNQASSGSSFPSARARANTINQMDAVPPALARLQHMNQDVIQGRNALTPVLNRDDAIREWERRQSGKATAAQPYPQLEYLHQQAELAAASGTLGWTQPSNRYPPPPSKLAQTYHPQTVMVDEDRRDAVMSNVRSAARGEGAMYGSTAAISAPAQTYASSATTTGNRYATTYATTQQQQSPTSPFDSIDQRTDIGNMYVPMQPNQFQRYNNRDGAAPPAAPLGGPSSRHIAPPTQAVPPSFYGAGVVSPSQSSSGSQQQRNPFAGNEQNQLPNETKRNSMDVWPR
jgi:dual specificity protein kinase YAK1